MQCWVCVYNICISKANAILWDCLSLHTHKDRLCVLKSHCFIYWQSITWKRQTGGNGDTNYFGLGVRKIAELQRSNLMLSHHLQKDFLSGLVQAAMDREWAHACVCLTELPAAVAGKPIFSLCTFKQSAKDRPWQHESRAHEPFLSEANFWKVVLFLLFGLLI